MKKFILFLILLFAAVAYAQQTPNFQTVAERRLKDKFNTKLSKVCDLQDVVAERVFREYGAIFVGNDVRVPGNCVFDNEASVYAFQAAALPEVANVGGVTVTLQKPAMAEYLAARRDAHKKGLDITPRGGSTASARSYATMLDLWRSRFDPALAYYVKRRSISPAEASAARSAPTREQVAMVLEWEKKGLYFSKDLSKSILYSVAVPGASQHGF